MRVRNVHPLPVCNCPGRCLDALANRHACRIVETVVCVCGRCGYTCQVVGLNYLCKPRVHLAVCRGIVVEGIGDAVVWRCALASGMPDCAHRHASFLRVEGIYRDRCDTVQKTYRPCLRETTESQAPDVDHAVPPRVGVIEHNLRGVAGTEKALGAS